jgi:hypothetical protein
MMKAFISLALLAAFPTLAHADPIATGPFYLRHDAMTADRKDIMAVVVDAQKLTGGTVYLCPTSASLSFGKQTQDAVRAELIANGISSALIRVGRRCRSALRHPPVSEAAKNAVVLIVGPSGRYPWVFADSRRAAFLTNPAIPEIASIPRTTFSSHCPFQPGRVGSQKCPNPAVDGRDANAILRINEGSTTRGVNDLLRVFERLREHRRLAQPFA